MPGHRERSRAWRGDCAEAGRWELCGVRAAAAVGSLWRMCGAQGVFYAEQDVCVPGRIRGRCAASERVLCGAGWECVQGACGSRGLCAGHGGCVGGTGVGEQRGVCVSVPAAGAVRRRRGRDRRVPDVCGVRGGCELCQEGECVSQRGMWGCGDLRGAVNPNVTGICCFIGKSGRFCAVRSGSCGLCRGWPGSARAPLGHRVPGEADPALERE